MRTRVPLRAEPVESSRTWSRSADDESFVEESEVRVLAETRRTEAVDGATAVEGVMAAVAVSVVELGQQSNVATTMAAEEDSRRRRRYSARWALVAMKRVVRNNQLVRITLCPKDEALRESRRKTAWVTS